MARRFVLTALAVLPSWVGVARGQELSADEIVRRYVAANGGARWHEVQTLRLRGMMELGHDVTVPFVQELKRPDKSRFEFEFRGETAVQAYDGAAGWQYRPYAGYSEPQRLDGEEAEDARRDAAFGSPLFDVAEKGHAVELAGQDEADGRRIYDLKVTLANGSVQHIFVDAGSFTEVKVTRKRSMKGSATDVTTFKSDYRWIGGLLLPFRIETQVAGSSERRGMTIEKVEIDVPIEDARFQPPAD